MCNLIHEEIISHPITGCQEDQVRSVLLPFLLSMKQSLPGHLRIQEIRCCGKYDRKDKNKKKKKKKKQLPSLPRYPTNPTNPPT